MEVNQWKDKSILFGPSYDVSGPFNIHQLYHRLLQTPDLKSKVALTCGPNSITFSELDQRATAVAAGLRAHICQSGCDPNKEQIVAVCLHPSVELIVSLLAIFKTGAAYLPLDPLFPAGRVSHIFSDAKPAVLLTTAALAEETQFNLLMQDHLSFILYENIEDTSDVKVELVKVGQELAVVLYTSGSTGTPKGVRLNHRNIHHRLSWQWKNFPYQPAEVACFKTALTFVDSIAEIWGPLLKGVPLVIVPKIITQNPEMLVATLEAYRISRLVLVPSLLSSLLTYVESAGLTKAVLQHLRLWICSGEVLTAQLLVQFYRNFGAGYQVCNFYGSTEVTGDVTYVTFRSPEDVESALVNNRIPLGHAVDNCAVYVLNSLNEIVDRGEIGEVLIAGAHVADGYIQAKQTVTSFIPNVIDERKGYEIMYRTGDYGRIANGMLYYEGRADSQIKVRGHRIDLTEINAVLNQLDQVVKGTALCFKPGQPEQEIIAFVVAPTSSPSSVHKSLKEKLISYAMPRVVIVEEIPLLVNGKIDRQLLLRDYAKNLKSKHSTPKWNENELNKLEAKERQIAGALFKTIISVIGGSLHKPLELADNYFYVGGNSLNAVIVVTKLKDQGFQLELGDFLEAENFRQIVFKMSSNQGIECCPSSFDYKIEMLNPSVKDEVIRIMCECFSQKGDLEILTGVTYEDYEALIPALWDPLLNANLSFTVKNNFDQVVAIGLHCDACDVPELKPKVKRLGYVFEILEFVKRPVREALVDNKKRHVLQNFLVATDGVLSPAENVALVQCVEQETLSIAKARGFKSIFTSNSSPLTQQICNDVLGYKILSEYQVNQFVASDGTRPFILAPDSQYITISVKNIH